ncbi:GPW/gp25 family protein [Selenomonas sp. F0473]|uniref:GPW/gp25 family protein n=1 Tax=Selenomonas sp. F0473 TaxID=999423 RepID=UPI0025F07605|nr:GPW/gp25 family protein [Selenomonas sp. F0473]
MTVIEIAGEVAHGINFAPQNVLEEVIQNVRTILTTRRGSVPLDRDFGMNTDFVDQPVSRVRAILLTEIIETVERYEPRVKVIEVHFSGVGVEGEVVPVVKVAIAE